MDRGGAVDDAFVGKQVAAVLEDPDRAARVRNRTGGKWGTKPGAWLTSEAGGGYMVAPNGAEGQRRGRWFH